MVSDSLTWVLVAILFFTKPAWCHAMHPDIKADCTIDSNGIKYNMSGLPLISPSITLIICSMNMMIILAIQATKAGLCGNKMVTRKLIIEIVICVCVILLYLFSEVLNYLPVVYGDNIVKIAFLAFVIVHNETIWNGIKALLSLLISGYLGIFLFCFT